MSAFGNELTETGKVGPQEIAREDAAVTRLAVEEFVLERIRSLTSPPPGSSLGEFTVAPFHYYLPARRSVLPSRPVESAERIQSTLAAAPVSGSGGVAPDIKVVFVEATPKPSPGRKYDLSLLKRDGSRLAEPRTFDFESTLSMTELLPWLRTSLAELGVKTRVDAAGVPAADLPLEFAITRTRVLSRLAKLEGYPVEVDELSRAHEQLTTLASEYPNNPISRLHLELCAVESTLENLRSQTSPGSDQQSPATRGYSSSVCDWIASTANRSGLDIGQHDYTNAVRDLVKRVFRRTERGQPDFGAAVAAATTLDPRLPEPSYFIGERESMEPASEETSQETADRHRRAEIGLRDALYRNPFFFDAVPSLALLRAEAGDWSTSAKLFEPALRVSPRPRTCAALARALWTRAVELRQAELRGRTAAATTSAESHGIGTDERELRVQQVTEIANSLQRLGYYPSAGDESNLRVLGLLATGRAHDAEPLFVELLTLVPKPLRVMAQQALESGDAEVVTTARRSLAEEQAAKWGATGPPELARLQFRLLDILLQCTQPDTVTCSLRVSSIDVDYPTPLQPRAGGLQREKQFLAHVGAALAHARLGSGDHYVAADLDRASWRYTLSPGAAAGKEARPLSVADSDALAVAAKLCIESAAE